MVFTEYMQSLPNQQQETISKLAELTCSTKVSVYRWVRGEVTPPPIKQKIIAEFFSRDIEELFPEEEKGVEHALESN